MNTLLSIPPIRSFSHAELDNTDWVYGDDDAGRFVKAFGSGWRRIHEQRLMELPPKALLHNFSVDTPPRVAHNAAFIGGLAPLRRF